MNSKYLILCTLLISGLAHADGRRGGGVVGSGGNGLVVRPAGNVIVGPPSSASTTLLIEGEAGDGQTDVVKAAKCRTTPQGGVEFGSCIPSERSITLQQATGISPGTYAIFYSNSMQFVTIKAGEQKRLKLSKIKIPDLANAESWQVFWDFTNSDAFDAFLIAQMSLADRSDFKEVCKRAKLPKVLEVCQWGRSPDLSDRKKLFQVDDFGNLSSLSVLYDDKLNTTEDGVRWKNNGRIYLIPPAPRAGFISVFPGVYGIEFNLQDGTTSNVYGIRVE